MKKEFIFHAANFFINVLLIKKLAAWKMNSFFIAGGRRTPYVTRIHLRRQHHLFRFLSLKVTGREPAGAVTIELAGEPRPTLAVPREAVACG